MEVTLFNKNKLKIILVILILVFSIIVFYKYKAMNNFYELFPSSNLKKEALLSDYFPEIKNKAVDTEIYFFEADKKGGTILILGGTHPNEPAGFLTSVLLLENINVKKGRVIIIPRANKSAFTHASSTEATLFNYSVESNNNKRYFRLGSRNTNPLHQLNSSLYYLHPSGQISAAKESRNLNRVYPGRKNGNLTEQLAYAITKLIKRENIDITFDFHEASPEYPVNNAVVAHEKALDTALLSVMKLQMQGINFSAESSPTKFRGLSHRELGDYTETSPFLFETPNPLQGKYRSKISEKLLKTGYDEFYEIANNLNLIHVSYNKDGWPLKKRVALQISLFKKIITTYNKNNKNKIIVENIPDYKKILDQGLANYLVRK